MATFAVFQVPYFNFCHISSTCTISNGFFLGGYNSAENPPPKTLVRMVIWVLHTWFIARFGSIFIRKNTIFSASFYG
jgi:hypothetical protein